MNHVLIKLTVGKITIQCLVYFINTTIMILINETTAKLEDGTRITLL